MEEATASARCLRPQRPNDPSPVRQQAKTWPAEQNPLNEKVWELRGLLQRPIRQFVLGFLAATETHSVPTVIPRHYHVTFLNCNTKHP